jgi:hypothetical protein
MRLSGQSPARGVSEGTEFACVAIRGLLVSNARLQRLYLGRPPSHHEPACRSATAAWSWRERTCVGKAWERRRAVRPLADRGGLPQRPLREDVPRSAAGMRERFEGAEEVVKPVRPDDFFVESPAIDQWGPVLGSGKAWTRTC